LPFPLIGLWFSWQSTSSYTDNLVSTKLINRSQYLIMGNDNTEQLVYTTSNGYPMESSQKYQRVNNGPLLLQDFHLLDLIAHFDRERIPERVVHAKGAGAYGEFEVTHDITDITSIDVSR